MHACMHILKIKLKKKSIMANLLQRSSSSSSSLLLVSVPLLVLALIFYATPSMAGPDDGLEAAATDDLIHDVCRHTQDPAFCATSLKSHPDAQAADLPGLAMIAVELSYKMAQDANDLALSLARNAVASPPLRRRYHLCLERFEEAMEEIKDARDEVKALDYIDASRAGLDATEEAQGCQDEFEMPPLEPSQLPATVSKLVTLSSAIFFIAGRLINNKT